MGNNLNNIDQLSVDRRKSSIAQLNETQSQIDLYSNNLSFINEAQCIARRTHLMISLLTLSLAQERSQLCT